ncbi:endonuclease domain-containing protein [Bradyrhizobium sp.]|uniref:endonuclease domain-containing protein n=1 Tax=Bradyrhizobium sp. TaxID=376 RepID=UPI003C6F4E5B
MSGLWRALKGLPLDGTHFRRQAPIGLYVVDFLCPAAHLIIELDGGHHTEQDTVQSDRDRQLWLEQEGYRVVRFWNSEIASNLNAVLERIYVELYGSREASVGPFKHFRRGKTVTPPRPLRGRPSPSRGG